jgi:hypothetical protein
MRIKLKVDYKSLNVHMRYNILNTILELMHEMESQRI